jgi:hypothetical protein
LAGCARQNCKSIDNSLPEFGIISLIGPATLAQSKENRSFHSAAGEKALRLEQIIVFAPTARFKTILEGRYGCDPATGWSKSY